MNKLLKNALSTVLLTFTLASLTSIAALANETVIIKKYTTDQLINFLKSEGYQNVKPLNGINNGILFKYEGKFYGTKNESNYFIVWNAYDGGCSLMAVNEYNKEFEQSKAVVYEDSCSVKAVLPSFYGVSKDELSRFYMHFLNLTVPTFRMFMETNK